MAVQLGGNARNAEKAEYGFAQIRAINNSSLLNNINDEISSEGYGLLDVWMSHGIEVTELPPDFKLIASSDNCEIAGFSNPKKHYYGLQFHPEVTHTKQGIQILEKFVTGICQCEKNWTTENIIEDLTKEIKNQVGEKKVLLGLSGGVDSSVVAVLLQKAIGNQLTCVFVDNGLLRLNEGNEVMKKLNNYEVRVTEVISFILEQYRNEKVNQNLEVASELILIARILHQRYKISNGTQVKEDKSVILAKNEILKEIKDDEYYELIKNFIKDYRQFRDKNIN